MEIRAVTITPDGTVLVGPIDATLAMVQKTVGGHIEPIACPPQEWVAWTNGQANSLELERNTVATTLLALLGWPGLRHGRHISGPIVITGSTDESELVDVEDAVVDLAFAVVYGAE